MNNKKRPKLYLGLFYLLGIYDITKTIDNFFIKVNFNIKKKIGNDNTINQSNSK